MTNKQRKILIVFLFLFLLSGCKGISVSPEDAAIKLLLNETTAGMQIDQDTLEVRHTIDVEDGQSIVMLSFQGTCPELGPVTCLYTYQTLQRMVGWMAANGGGGCRETHADRQPQGFEIMGGHYSGQRPQDPGYTQIYGSVHHPEIVKALVTWDDSQVTEVEVVNGTIITVRTGDFKMQEVEGLNAQDQVIYTYTQSTVLDMQP